MGRGVAAAPRGRWGLPFSSALLELPSSSETASGSVGSMSKYCWPLRGVVRLRSADLSMSAPAAHIVLRSRITPAVIAIAQSVRPLLAHGGLLHAAEYCSHA